MAEAKLARILRVVLLIWLVASIALVVAMMVALLPLPDQDRRPRETRISRSAGVAFDRCFTAATHSPPVNTAVAAPFRHLTRVSYFLVQNTESRSEGRASLWRSDPYEENQIE